MAGVLLAAGRGTRFGHGKLIHPLADGVPIAVHAARHLRAAGLHVTAVVRPGDSALHRLLVHEGCTVTPCPDAALGMGHSLAHGIAHAPDDAGWLVALADMPSIRPDTIVRVARAVVDGAGIAAPVYRGERGHPVGFAARHRDALLALTGDMGARRIMQDHRDDLVLVECDDPGVVYDIDTRADADRPV